MKHLFNTETLRSCASVLIVLMLSLVCACRSKPSSPAWGEKPVRYGESVNVAIYDTTLRSPVSKLEVFQGVEEVGGRAYHVIALLSRGGNAGDEGLVMNAIAWRARQLGADGLIVLPPLTDGDRSVNVSVGAFSHSRDRHEPVFRANAIIFDGKAGDNH